MDALISALAEVEPAKVLHILVNNSGASWGAPFDAVPEDKGWDNIMAVNVKSIFYREGLKYFSPHFLYSDVWYQVTGGYVYTAHGSVGL